MYHWFEICTLKFYLFFFISNWNLFRVIFLEELIAFPNFKTILDLKANLTKFDT